SSQPDHQGLAFFPYSTEWERNKQLLIVRKDTDSALLPGNYTWWSLNAYSPNANRQDQLRWFVFDDRKLYQPGEVLKLKGWIRQLETKKGGDLILGKWFRELVAYQVHDAAGRSLAKGALRLNVFGGFDGSISIPTNADLGEASVSFTLRGTIAAKLGNLTYRHPFDIYQFRRPEYELKVTTSDGPHVIGTSALATVFAGYFAGGPLKKAETRWEFSLIEGQYQPPHHDDFVFGDDRGNPWRLYNPIGSKHTFAGLTDADGRHTVEIQLDELTQPRPVVITAEATMSDVNRQTQSSSTKILVHPSHLCVGLKSHQQFIFSGETFEIETIVTDLDGQVQAGKSVKFDVVRLER
ncbi:MAG TPA: MG2 domain-containing protein, partial [Acidobacteriota bacterium]|nr:MG2 domain-containing protein [Acidobacteriota bacterium]